MSSAANGFGALRRSTVCRSERMLSIDCFYWGITVTKILRVVTEREGMPAKRAQALELSRRGGIVVWFWVSPPGAAVPVEQYAVYRKELTVWLPLGIHIPLPGWWPSWPRRGSRVRRSSVTASTWSMWPRRSPQSRPAGPSRCWSSLKEYELYGGSAELEADHTAISYLLIFVMTTIVLTQDITLQASFWKGSKNGCNP